MGILRLGNPILALSLSPGGPGALHSHARAASQGARPGYELPFSAECKGVSMSPRVHRDMSPQVPSLGQFNAGDYQRKKMLFFY